MELILRNWYDKFLEEISNTSRLRIVVPFVKEQIVRKIQEKFDLEYLELITRFDLKDFASGVSDLQSLKFAVSNNASVFGISPLHSKIYIFDSRAAIVSSANLTYAGLISNHECGILLNDRRTVDKILRHFEDLKSKAGGQLTLEQCDSWQDELSKAEIPNSSISALPDFGSSTTDVDPKRNYYVKFFGTSKNRESLNFNSREEITRALCHYACGFSESKKPRQINDGDIIYMARMTENPRDYAIFGKAEAIKFVDDRDRASKLEIQQRPWKAKWPIYLRLTNPTFIDGTMADCVLLYDLIRALNYESFPSTKRRYENGERNINPYNSLSQQAYVKLSHAAVKWLEPRFQEGLKRVGKVDKVFIDSLPQAELQL